MKKLTLMAFTLGLFASCTGAQAADLKHGKELHDKNCMSCHAGIMGGNADSIYTRPNHRIDNYDALLRQVGRCKDNLGVSWPKQEVADVAAYLDHEFYHFGKTK